VRVISNGNYEKQLSLVSIKQVSGKFYLSLMKIAIINGPNLNLLGKREPEIYGSKSFEEYLDEIKAAFPSVVFTYFQSNVEGELINAIQQAGDNAEGIILNPAGYTHTSVALGDAIAAVKANVLEVHISNIHAREDFRKISHVSAKCVGTITGLGLKGYELAVNWFMQNEKG
jgi:3-dehydroquinate dehydratase-2